MKIFTDKPFIWDPNNKIKGFLKIGAVIGGCLIFSLLFFSFLPHEGEEIDALFGDNFFKLRYTLAGKEKTSPYIIPVLFSDIEEIPSDHKPKRMMFANLITILKDMDVSSVGYDILFLDEKSTRIDQDLTTAIKEAGNVYLPVIPDDRFYQTSRREDLFAPSVLNGGNPYSAKAVQLPFDDLIPAAKGFGHAQVISDRDGVHRKYPLFYQFNGKILPSLALRLVCDFLEVSPDAMDISYGSHLLLPDARFPGDIVKDLRIPINERGEVVINFAGPWGDSFSTYPLWNILASSTSPVLMSELKEIMEDSIVFVSDVSTRSKDYAPGIFEEIYPSCGLHLNVLNGILTENFIVPLSLIAKIALAIFTIFLVWILAVRVKIGTFLVGASLLYTLLFSISFLAFLWGNIVWEFGTFSLIYLFTIVVLHIYRLQYLRVQLLNRRLKEEKEQNRLLQANRMIALGSLSSSIAHEIANPNSAIASNTAFLQKTVPQILEVLEEYTEEKGEVRINRIPLDVLREKITRSLEGSAISATRIEHIVAELRKFYLKKNDTPFVDVDINEVIKSALFLTAHKIKKGAIETILDINKTPLWVKGDFQKIEQVVINIILNAVHGIGGKKESGFRGILKVGTISEDDGENCAIIIEDNGTGIEKQHLEKITEPFFSTRLDSGGSGLGLHISKTIITSHKGDIQVSSVLGEKTVVKILLPGK